jgi:hypothetical protein
VICDHLLTQDTDHAIVTLIMALYGVKHQEACSIQKLLIAKMNEADGKQAAAMALAWEKLERLKREIRGIPPLKACDPIAGLRSARTPRLAAPAEPVEA